ncbi:MAG: glycosyltransferase family 1 protein [Candidatus Omnitrophica bacterium]|nr:glycosyltransferase family 1 protein [Candidatus Omnitrophota bacterium]
MKVFFDARMITHPGIGRYIRSIVPLLKGNAGIELTLLGNREAIKRYLNVEESVIDFNYPIYSIQEQIGYCRIKKIIGDNVLHIPHYNIPFLARFNLVVTLHDLIHIMYPGGARNKFACVYMYCAMRRSLRVAKKIICVSAATRDSIQKIFNPQRKNLEVISEGISDVFFKIVDAGYLKNVKARFNLPDNFILYVGSIRKHKNIDSLLAAFTRLKKIIPSVMLVLVGKLAQKLDCAQEGVMYLGEVPDEDLVGIYNCASVFCNLSLYEGFSLTLLEAQKCAVPVVCSDIPVHRDTADKGAIFVPATDVDQIKDALYNVLTDSARKASCVDKGLLNVNRFDWNRAAQQIFEIYKSVNNL